MKKIITILVFLISNSTFSQSGWQVVYYGDNQSSPYYKKISFTSAETGWIMCNDHLKKTTDSGFTWTRYGFNHSYVYLRAFHFLNDLTGWVVETKYLNYTSNGGNNWIIVDSTLGDPRSIFFINSNTGWLCESDGLIKRTTNSGNNWSLLQSGTTNHLNKVIFVDNNTGYCAGDWGTILSTTNGGGNWNVFLDSYLGFFNKINFVNSQTGFVGGTGNNIYRTTNSGMNWWPHYINNIQLTEIDHINNSIYSFTNTDEIYRSDNNGIQWSLMQTSGIDAMIISADIQSSSRMWIAADSGILYRSTDLGTNWNEIYRDYLTKENLNSVHFIDNMTGFACGNKGLLYKSVNGGINWSQIATGTNYNLTTIQFTQNNTGYICGGNGSSTGLIKKTTNAGNNWQTVYNDSAHFNSMHFINSNTGWATGLRGIVMKTTNGGNDWIRYRTQFNSTNYKIVFTNENTGFLTKNVLYRSTNGGMNWSIQLNVNTQSIFFINNTGYLTHQQTNNVVLYKTTNEGSNWITYLAGSNGTGILYFIDAQTGWLSGINSIKKTINGGMNWTDYSTPNPSMGIAAFYFKDENYGWAVGSGGSIMRTISGGIGITQISSEVPSKFLLQQNYPNPFNPVTKIRFTIPAFVETTRRVVSMRIYDVLGKEIAMPVNEELKPGTYETEWNASNYSSGIYFYSLTTENFTQTRRMVLIK